ncbi:MAG: hypothetical protein IJ716_15720 [Lachnospiraceae bacterium]|nr:hypothetical protein [Lachnospiraceae bacterium]
MTEVVTNYRMHALKDSSIIDVFSYEVNRALVETLIIEQRRFRLQTKE